MRSLVSIIIPIYNSYDYLLRCLRSIQNYDAGVKYELILVNDGSTDPRINELLMNFERTIVQPNQGFIRACNHGARIAVGDFLLFLNSDTEILNDGWLKKLLQPFKKDPSIGIVGPKLIFSDNTVQHCGLEFSPRHLNFVHRYYRVHKKDPRVMQSCYVPALTGAAFLVRKDLWEKLKGFDETYLWGYFEDSDFCMRAKEIGYKSYYCSEVEILHHQSRSTGGCPQNIFFHNHEIFKKRWVRTSKLVKYPKIAACYIVFNEEEFIRESILSIYDFVHKIIIVEGSTKYNRQYAKPDGSSSDKTVEKIKSIKDRQNKILLIQGKWEDKTSMRNKYCEYLSGYDYAFIIDGDEVWSKEDLAKVEQLMFSEPNVQAFSFNMLEFWKDLSHISRGVWEKFLGRKTLIKLDKGLSYKDHLTPIDKNGNVIRSKLHPEIKFFHYNYVKSDEKIRQKFEYYRNKGTPGFNLNKNWFEQVWKEWDKDPLKVEAILGTHPFGGGYSIIYEGDHPEVMKGHPLYLRFLEERNKMVLFTNDLSFNIGGFKRVTFYDMDVFNLPIPSNFLRLIYIQDFLSYLTLPQINKFLNYCYNLLDDRGEIKIVEVDFRKVISLHKEGHFNFDQLNSSLMGRGLHQLDHKKSLLEPYYIKLSLLSSKFRKVLENKRDDIFFELIAFK